MSDAACIITECGRDAEHRGLCKSCWNQAGKAVRAGETTWEELEAVSLARPAHVRRGSSHPFRRALDRALAHRKTVSPSAPKRRNRAAAEAASGPVEPAVDMAAEEPRKRLVQKR